jgi:hypothetical protein
MPERSWCYALPQSIKPGCSQAEMLYFSAMVDVDGDGHVTFDEMLMSMRECKVLRAL